MMNAAQQSVGPKGHILCVDDEHDILSIAQTSLEAIGGFEVTVCNSGPEALDVLRNFQPDLVLLDVMMPNMGGPATLKAIKELPNCTDLPIVFMTARVQPSEVEAYLAMGAKQVISKPFDPMTLSDQVQGILDLQLQHKKTE
ncbi:response regulator [Maritalea myrionectae]|uniref:response regulator n=1 Tax=Maritalea myrionectae TaxID=454601 RepID=UPI0004000158|nr:response regulator [Maritalea myrionectae]